MNQKLAINEIFTSISGEVGIIPQGELTTVVRLQGCNLHCNYCDAKDSQEIRQSGMEISVVADKIKMNSLPILITGGEPLVQKLAVLNLIRIVPQFYPIQIETNGTISIVNIPEHVCVVMDYKLINPPTPDNLFRLKSCDYLKFVVGSHNELERTMYLMQGLYNCRATLAISATDVTLYPAIIERIKETSLRILINVQLHKFIGVQ